MGILNLIFGPTEAIKATTPSKLQSKSIEAKLGSKPTPQKGKYTNGTNKRKMMQR